MDHGTERPPIRLAEDRPAAADQITFIGTATTLISVAGFSILTDPNFLHQGDRAYLGLGLSSRRRTDPARSIDQLPDLDFVVLSHHHGDHFDRVAARDLDHRLPIITVPQAARKLRKQGFRAPVALSTWQSQVFTRADAEVRITSVPGKHAPRPLGYALPPVMGSVLDFSGAGQRPLRVYITGDTLLHDGIDAIAGRFPGIDLCLIHLGGTRIAGVLLTMDARQGVEALRIIAPREAIPIHYDDYTVFRSPLADFKRLAGQADLPTSIHYLERGETYPLTRAGSRPS
ncbi:MAG: MBL fold metallo-hydrolase [Actinobacteria bacterium]|nr:MBL fold metallo-hydrolase [Actinomycetota bacterium]